MLVIDEVHNILAGSYREQRPVEAPHLEQKRLRTSQPLQPLEIVQVDHTRADIIVVDEETREPSAGSAPRFVRRFQAALS